MTIEVSGKTIETDEEGYLANRTDWNEDVAKDVQEALKRVQVYALKPDVEARGMQNRVMDGVRLVDYGGFVDLVVEHDAVQSWL